jgi:hypothetical protein
MVVVNHCRRWRSFRFRSSILHSSCLNFDWSDQRRILNFTTTIAGGKFP